MISYDGVKKSEIRNHYELGTLFYRLFWGVHIHHGLWNGNESPRQAQRQLIEHLLNRSNIARGATVVDVGCGMGGSALHLARNHGCQVTGITLSGLQRWWASGAARLRGASAQTCFLRRDAETADFDTESFDYLWSIECTEHLFDKPAFFRRAATWLRPGGGIAICAWLAGDEPHSEEGAAQVKAVCDAFLCPSLGTAEDYANWLVAAGLHIQQIDDLTPRITRTWEICQRRTRRAGIAAVSRMLGKNMLQFVNNFETILTAYRSGAMKYCSIIAKKD